MQTMKKAIVGMVLAMSLAVGASNAHAQMNLVDVQYRWICDTYIAIWGLDFIPLISGQEVITNGEDPSYGGGWTYRTCQLIAICLVYQGMQGGEGGYSITCT